MALARVLEIIALLIYIQGSRGHYNGLINNNPTLGQNNLSQGFQNAANVKSVTENLGTKANIITQKEVSSQQSSIPQSSSFQQSQNFPHLINQQSSQTSESTQPVLYKPQLSLMQQSPIVQQQSYNSLDSPTAFLPANNVGKINIKYHQQATPSVQQVPFQVAQSIPVSNAYVPTYPSISSIPSSGGQRIDLVANLGGHYLFPINTFPYSVPEGQIVNSFPTYATTLTTPSLPTVENNVIVPYQSFDAFDNPLDNASHTAAGDDITLNENDNLTKLLMSLLDPPKKSRKYLQSDYQGSSYAPYTIYKIDQDSNPSSLKSLLPIIINLIKERREGCGCYSTCHCNRKKRNKIKSTSENDRSLDTEKKDYILREEMFCHEKSEEDIPRITREHMKDKNVKSHIPDVSIECNDNDSRDYDHSSEEQDD
ncbi:unnamed protein product [Euphydryas editha]|uniref:Uncharacterized protein n=1 Tax=Euphydryas editha TaxID=104508 RepID=A0AAU9UP15_EUPED|nr:unnamed protein product [Euphydryas editha]